MKQELPKLPHGQGNLYYYRDDIIGYRKQIILPDGTKVRKTVYGKTIKECFSKMDELEKGDFKEVQKKESYEVLEDALNNWAEKIKKPELKKQSYDRLLGTIRQIGRTDIGHLCYTSIRPEEIQDELTKLNDARMSQSTIKKFYDTLNAFYRYASDRYEFKNPMKYVTMIVKHNIKVEQKQIEWFEEGDIRKFIDECGAKWNTGTYKYNGGYVYAANMFMGLRIGELLALQWQDVDFEKKQIYVCKTLTQITNEDYDENVEDSKKNLYVIQKSTKRDYNRYVPINSKAMELLNNEYKKSTHNLPDDLVIATRNNKPQTIKNAKLTINEIEENADTKVKNSGTHILRHTAASLMFKNNVPIDVIAKILGHSVEVCRTTYIHFSELQIANALNNIYLD